MYYLRKYANAFLVLWANNKKDIERRFLSCHVIIGYIIEGVVILCLKNINSCLIIYQTLFLCLPAHPCVQSYLLI